MTRSPGVPWASMISTQPLATTIRSKSRSPGEKRICPALTCSRRPAASIVAICASVRRGKVTSLSPATVGPAGAAPVGSVSLIEAATLEARLALSQGLPSRRRPVHIRTDRRDRRPHSPLGEVDYGGFHDIADRERAFVLIADG